MSEIKENALELIGGTPLLKLNRYSRQAEVTDAVILAKLEYLNPAGSVKDRIAPAMIEDAERDQWGGNTGAVCKSSESGST